MFQRVNFHTLPRHYTPVPYAPQFTLLGYGFLGEAVGAPIGEDVSGAPPVVGLLAPVIQPTKPSTQNHLLLITR